MPDHHSRTNRRKFLVTASASALAIAAHQHLDWAAPISEEAGTPDRKLSARIRSLELMTATPLKEMKTFYHSTLGLPVLKESKAAITFGGGKTPITFRITDPEHGAPFYHFAFNIPENKLLEARTWQLDRTELLPIFPELRDPDYPDDVIHFKSWNAHSIYFLDPAGNILEYIARHDLENGSSGPFTEKKLLYASEIAFVVDDVGAMASGLQETFRLNQYRQGGDTFRAIGDEYGLLLVFQRGRNMSRGFGKPKPGDVFPTMVGIRDEDGTTYTAKDFPYEITGV
jgi:catechol 2,3-dioxygenase-like lactoylglutathione lyase family enzyme